MRIRLAVATSLVALVGFSAFLAPGEARGQNLFSRGQSTQASSASQDTSGAPPRAIPISEIPLRAEDALARLKALRTQLAIDPSLLLIEDELPAELAELSRGHEQLGRILLEQLSLRELSNLSSIWRTHEERLSRWSEAFDKELSDVARAAESKEGIQDVWKLTAEELRAEDSPPSTLVDRAQAVLDRALEVQNVLRDRLSYLTGVKSQIDDALASVEQVIGELDGASESVRRKVLSRTAAPIWAVRSLKEQSESQRAARMWGEDRNAIGSFLSNNLSVVLLSCFLLVLFAVLSIRLRDRIQREDVDLSDESVRGAVDTLRHPISASFLITALVSHVLWPPSAPLIFWQLVSFAAVIPLYRMLPRSSNPVINRTVRALLILYALVELVDVLLPPSLEYRLFNLVEAVTLAAVSSWLLLGADRDEMGQTLWGRVVYRGLRVTVVTSVISVAANVFGWTLLAEILLIGTLVGAFAGLGVVIAYRVLAGLIRLVPRTKMGQESAILRTNGDVVTSRAITVLRVAAFITWLLLALAAFEIVQPIKDWLGKIMTSPLHVGALEFTLERLVSSGLILLVSIWGARFVAFVLDVEILPRFHKLKRGVANAVSTVVQWSILGVGLLIAAGALGLEAGQLAIVFGALGVGIGFGLQNVVSNFVSGLILIFEQPVKVGDKVEITQLSLVGEVRRIGIRASVVRTFDGAEVIVPNGNLISSEVVNWTLTDQRRRVRVEVGVAYGTDPHRVLKVLKGVADDHREVLRYPEPNVLFVGFGDSSLNFRLQFWTANFDDFFRIQSEITVAVHDALKEAGITIPFPQRDLHVKSMPTSVESIRGNVPGAGTAERAPDEQPDGDAVEGSGQEPVPAG